MCLSYLHVLESITLRVNPIHPRAYTNTGKVSKGNLPGLKHSVCECSTEHDQMLSWV